MTDPCSYLDWDSSFFHKRIARVNGHLITPDSISPILEWCEQNNIDCLYFESASDNDTSVIVAEEAGFHLVDIRVELNCKMADEPIPPARKPRLFQESDLEPLQKIASNAYRDSRFYYDSNFSREQASELYRHWITKSCQGYANAVFVIDHNDHPSAFITCHIEPDAKGRIGLVGVSPDARSTGLGISLVRTAQNYFYDKGIHEINVVTQGRNIAAQRLYQLNGFKTSSVTLWFHRWKEITKQPE
jgi:dTDP-4-amino-4,6-dideoxy-D-galactose acyltransferase